MRGKRSKQILFRGVRVKNWLRTADLCCVLYHWILYFSFDEKRINEIM